MQFQIPQFIETEDKIVGPFSLRQFLWVGGAAGISALLYFLIELWIWLPMAVIIMAIGVGFGLIKMNGRPLSRVALSAAHFFWSSRIYSWQPEGSKTPMPGERGEKRSALYNIASGVALSSIWERVQTGTSDTDVKIKTSIDRMKEKYQIINKLSGERQAAKRIDYR